MNGKPTGLTTSLFNAMGAIRCMSPELLFHADAQRTLESDIWALGCVILVILTDEAPYSSSKFDSNVILKVANGELPANIDDISAPPAVIDLLLACWQQEPERRPTASHIVEVLSKITITGETQPAITRSALLLRGAPQTTWTADVEAHREDLEAMKREFYHIDPSRISPDERLLAAGGFGHVYHTILDDNTPTRREVAVKKLWCSVDRGYLRVAVGNVDTYLQAVKPPYAERIALAIDTAEGLNYLHTLSPPVCHGDIKMGNALILDDGPRPRAVLCDFGLAKVMDNKHSGLTTTGFDTHGTTLYFSPEIIIDESPRTLKSDIWAWGCLLFQMLTDMPLYDGAIKARIILQIAERVPPADVEAASLYSGIRDLLRQCWEQDPAVRPTMARVLETLQSPTPAYVAEAPEDESPVLPPQVPRKLSFQVVPRRTLTTKTLFGNGNVQHLSVSADGQYLVAAFSAYVKLFNTSSGNSIQKYSGTTSAVCLNPNGKFLVTSFKSKIQVWDPSRSTLVGNGTPWTVFPGHSDSLPIHVLQFSPDGSFLTSAADDGTVRLWRIFNANHRTLQIPTEDSSNRCPVAVAISSDSRQIVASCQTGQ
ncbi:hypothetical protein FRB99_000377, partial [Tulasnella sp. 403]